MTSPFWPLSFVASLTDWLITNDGSLAHDLLAPGKHVPKTYYAKVAGSVTEEDVEKFAAGLEIGEKKPALPAELRILFEDRETSVEHNFSAY